MRHVTIGAALVTAALLVAGCQSWHGDAEVRLTNGSKYRCDKGIEFHADGVTCWTNASYKKFNWTIVAGYEAR